MDSTPTPRTGSTRRAKLFTVVAAAALIAAVALLAFGKFGASAVTWTLFVGVALLATGDWRESRRTHRPEDGEGEGGGGDPRRPQQPESPTGGIEFDFERFAAQFWAHVEQLERVNA